MEVGIGWFSLGGIKAAAALTTERCAVTGLVKSCLYQPFSKETDDKRSRDEAGFAACRAQGAGRVREGV